MLDGAPDRIALDGLGQRKLIAARQALKPDQHVGGPQRQQHVVAGQADMPRVRTVAVQHGGHPAAAPDLAGSALAEFVPRLGGDTYLGHGGTPQR